jgi:hypothetical protein
LKDEDLRPDVSLAEDHFSGCVATTEVFDQSVALVRLRFGHRGVACYRRSLYQRERRDETPSVIDDDDGASDACARAIGGAAPQPRSTTKKHDGKRTC